MFIKVYSWDKIKSIAVVFFIMLLLLVSIFIYCWGDIEERVVFHRLQDEITLIVTPEEASVLYVNDEPMGEEKVNRKTPHIFRIKSNDTLHIKMVSPGSTEEENSTEKTLSFKDGRLSVPEGEEFWDNMSISQWPNQVYHISMHLPAKAKVEFTGQEVVLQEEVVDLNDDNDLEKVQLVKQGKYHFLKINEKNKILLKDYNQEQSQWFIKDINENGKKEIIIKGALGSSHRYIEIFQYQDEQLERIFWAWGDDIALFTNGRILAGKRLFDTVDHYSKITYQWEGDQYKEVEKITSWWRGRPQWPMEPKMTVKAFFEAYELELMKEAQGYLTPSNQNPDGMETILGAITEGWNRVSFPSYYFFEKNNAENMVYLAFSYSTDIHPRYKEIKIYEFELQKQEDEQGPWKIENVNEIKNYAIK